MLFSGTNVSHAVVFRPLQFGYFNFSAAEVSYKPSENSATELVSLQGKLGNRTGEFTEKLSNRTG